MAAEPVTDVDTTAADMLEQLDEELNGRGVSLVFAEMKDPVRAKIDRYELTRTIDPRTSSPRSTPRSRRLPAPATAQGGADVGREEGAQNDG